MQFSPTAWAKLLFLRDCGETEVDAFSVCPNDPLLVEDVVLIRQRCTYATVEFDDDAVADFFDRQVDNGLRPEQFARIWIHTHPGDCANPSHTDEETFARVFGQSNWAVMFILACGGETYARPRFNVGPTTDVVLSVGVYFTASFTAADRDVWYEEYLRNVSEKNDFTQRSPVRMSIEDDSESFSENDDDWYEAMYFRMLEEEGADPAHGY